MTSTAWTPLRLAWEQALYGPDGFYRRELPRDHFRTSVHESPLFARALVELVRRFDLDALTDLGAGTGELLVQVERLAPDLELTAVEVRPRPADLPGHIAWRLTGVDLAKQPERVSSPPFRGLVLANEVLDNVACDVVEMDVQGVVRLVEVHVDSGRERLGPPAGTALLAWLSRWWPLEIPGHRAEVGLARDQAWAAICARNRDGVSLAIDYGHTETTRPPLGTLSSYRAGRQVPVCFDGRHDVTAHVAIDAVAAAGGGRVVRQRDALADLGVSARRPPPEQASTAPADYVRGLAEASAAAELTATPGLGDFCWILPPVERSLPLR